MVTSLTKCFIKQRANNPQQKALRRQQILLAARERFEHLSYEEVNLNHIAADVGITKAALYRYFRNKESLFLALFIESLEALVKQSEHLQQIPLAEAIGQALIKQPLYCKLSAILHSILERNLTHEEAFAFKKGILALTAQFRDQIRQHPDGRGLSDTAATELVMQIQETVIGAWHMTHPSGAIAEVIKQPDLQVFNRQFATSLKRHIAILVAGAFKARL